ncbi:MAG: hypothetical protein P1U34_01550 [Coxiellaceae bacterium]|nr:hypothetical protein [Coxiellaceae bacterium]
MSRFFKGEPLSRVEIAERKADGYRLLLDDDGAWRDIDWGTKKGIQKELGLALAELIPAAVVHNKLLSAGILREGQVTRFVDRVQHISEVVRVALEFNAAILSKWTAPDGFVRATQYIINGESVNLKPLGVMVADMSRLVHNSLDSKALDKAFGCYLLPDGAGKVKSGSKSEHAMTYVELKGIVTMIQKHLDGRTKDLASRKGGAYIGARQHLSPAAFSAEQERARIEANAGGYRP